MITRWESTIWISLPNSEKLGDYVVNVIEASSDIKRKESVLDTFSN